MRVLGIDPGNFTGFAVGEIDDNYTQLNILYTETFDINKSNNYYINTSNHHPSPNMVKYITLSNKLTELINQFNIDGVCCEDVYVHPRFPQATASLMKYISTIESHLWFRHDLKVQFIHNRMIKKMLSQGTNTKKEIKDCINNIGMINLENKKELTEHEYDAISVIYSHVMLIQSVFFHRLF